MRMTEKSWNPQTIAGIIAVVAVSVLITGCFGGAVPRPGSVEGYVFKPTEARSVAGASRSAGLAQNARNGLELKIAPAARRGVPAAPEGYEPCAGAVVSVTGSSGTAVTDAMGYFRKDGITPGTQTVSIVYEPFRLDTKVLVRSGQVTTLNGAYGNLLGKWTVMVYMCADNNLESAAIADLNELEEVGSTGEVNILVQIDRAKGFDKSNGDWTGTRRYYVTRDPNPPGSADYGTVVSPLAPWDGNNAETEVDMADPASLRDFVAWCMASYPAQHYVLVLWDHGDGWTIWRRPRVAPRAICLDEESGRALDLDQVRAALEGLPRLAVIGFDACLMQMIEVAYEMRGVADIAVGSEGLEPEEGWDYNEALSGLCADPYGTSPWDFAMTVVDSYLASYGTASGVTLSAFRLEEADGIAAAVKALSDELVRRIQANSGGTDASRIKQALAAARLETLRYWGYPHFDIVDFARKLSSRVADPAYGVSAAAKDGICAKTNALLQALSGPWLYAGRPEASAYGNGLSIYLPDRYFAAGVYGYDYLQFEQDTHWSDIFQYVDP
ncbi:MAG: clostripain-related cysteine peptidase [Firmicutes bacterium]|nr:clostripain-related cysteine peptidase [Bacillota bacterium]MDH7495767.1 clostripain-related cysteine peptidase [Bacillota bacterium]